MTVGSEYLPHSYHPGDALAAEALPGIVFLDPDDLAVIHEEALTGARTLLARGDDYTVAGDGAAGEGTVTALAEWPADDRWIVVRATALLQQVDLAAFERLPAEAVEAALDRMMLGVQEARETAGRALRVPLGEDQAELPPAAARAGKVLAADPGDGSIGFVDFTVSTVAGDAFANRILLAAATGMAAGQIAFLTEGVPALHGRFGTFAWSAANHAAAVAADPQQGLYVPPASDPSGASGAWVRQADGPLDACWFGAKGDGVTDDTAAFNAAIAWAKANGGGTVTFPAGNFNVSSVNAANFNPGFDKQLVLKGAGMRVSRLVGNTNGAVVLDLIGTNDYVLEDFEIGTAPGVSAQTGLLLARSATSGNCNGGRIKNVGFRGSFSLAAAIAIAAESTSWYSPRFENSHVGALHKAFYTSNYNDIGVTSANGVPQASSNTSNAMHRPTFYLAFVTEAYGVHLHAAAGYTFNDAEVINGGGPSGILALYTLHGSEDVFNGPVTWNDPLFEGQTPIVHALDGKAGVVSYFKNIRHLGGYSNVYAGTQTLLGRNTAGGRSYTLQDCAFGGMRFNAGQTVIFGIDNVETCDIDLRSASATTELTITGFQRASRLRAGTVVEAPVSVDYHGTSHGAAPPAAGTFARGHIRFNTALATMGLGSIGLIGWECVIEGTPGTWAPIYRGGAAGDTGGRPASGVPVGFAFFDTTLGKPVWFKSPGWVDATGAAA